jgi:hypothetical protein
MDELERTTLKNHEQELIKNLTTDGWKATPEEIDFEEELYCVKAQKKIYFFFNRIHVYILLKDVNKDNLKNVIDIVNDEFYKYHALWVIGDSFTEKVKEFVNNTQQIGLIQVEVE